MTNPIALSSGRRWKSLLLTLVLLLSTGMALALPSPDDIARAVNAGQYAQAESMLNEVLHDKPNSAKAHYELGQVLEREGRVFEARGELQKAQTLDPSLKFASDPQRFNDMLAKLNAATAPTRVQPVPAPAPAQYHAPAPAPASSSFPWLIIIGLVILGIIGLMLLRRSALQSSPAVMGGGTMGGASMGGYGPGPMYPNAPVGGSGVGGAVLGGVAGLAAGYGLAKMMEHGDDRTIHYEPYSASDQGSSAPSAPDLGSFDAGSGGGWDDGGGSGGGGDVGGGGDW